MFTIKATYNNETRRFTVQDSSFPSFDTIQSQLYRVFPIRGSYYLARLMFCPSEGSRVVVGKEVHNETQYNEHIAPFSGRLWPNGLLRFNVVDEIPHKAPFAASTSQSESENPFVTRLARPVPRRPTQTSTYSSSMDVDDDATTIAPSNRHSMFSQSSQQSCCSIAEGKEEMKELMSGFLRDVHNVMSSTFGDGSGVSSVRQAVPPETSVAQQKSTDDTSEVAIPGAFVHPAPSVSPPVPEQKPVHEGVLCDYCGKDVHGARFKCQECPDFDLCEDCVTQRNAKSVHQAEHAEREGVQVHSFFEIAKPGDPIQVPGENAMGADSQGPLPPPKPTHTDVICDLCDATIVGNRHRCLDCPDFDLCDNCFPRRVADHPDHEFVSFTNPRRIVMHWVTEGDETPRSTSVRPFSPFRPSASVTSSAVHHANCDLCDSRIRGVRYKCLSCPDFDTCASCYTIVPEQHPKHTFVKLETHQDLSPRDPSLYKKHLARCNECGATIRGVRYKCLHPECPDYDLCSKCEALPIEVHPAIHPMVKLRSPDVVIPTVYRVGSTSLIDTPVPRPETTGTAVATDPEPEKADVAVVAESMVEKSDASVTAEMKTEKLDASVAAEMRAETSDASVHAEMKVDKADASVSTVTPTPVVETVDRSIVMPVLPTPPSFNPSTGTEVLQSFFASLLRDKSPRVAESSLEATKGETVQATADFPTLPPLFSTFTSKHPLYRNNAFQATFVSDINVEDGQVFPPGAEFVKCWRIRNDGEVAWPESTCVIFVAGDRMPSFATAPLSYHVGRVETGATVDVTASDMKAPEIPGNYVGYWRLSDGTEPFGQSVWCEISVPVPSTPSRMHSSLTASEVVMPELSNTRSSSVIQPGGSTVPDLAPATSVPATPTMSAPSTDIESTDSLLDEFDTASDEEYWEASREHASVPRMTHADAEYVVLYDEQSTDDDGN